MTRRFWAIWIALNIAWFVGVPWGFGVWLANEVRAEYASGARVSTDSDSISIPIAGVIVVNTAVIVVVNLGLGIYVLLKRRRAT
jgi:hypothetical protein